MRFFLLPLINNYFMISLTKTTIMINFRSYLLDVAIFELTTKMKRITEELLFRMTSARKKLHRNQNRISLLLYFSCFYCCVITTYIYTFKHFFAWFSIYWAVTSADTRSPSMKYWLIINSSSIDFLRSSPPGRLTEWRCNAAWRRAPTSTFHSFWHTCG